MLRKKNIKDKLVIGETINNNFFVITINEVQANEKKKGLYCSFRDCE